MMVELSVRTTIIVTGVSTATEAVEAVESFGQEGKVKSVHEVGYDGSERFRVDIESVEFSPVEHEGGELEPESEPEPEGE